MPSLTQTLPNLEADGPCLRVTVAITSAAEEAFSKEARPIPPPIAVVALIDTGATGTVIQQGLAQQLGLQPVGAAWIQTPASSDVLCDKYAVRLSFMDGLMTLDTTVIEAPLRGVPIQCLIGRDVLSRSILIYNGNIKQFTICF